MTVWQDVLSLIPEWLFGCKGSEARLLSLSCGLGWERGLGIQGPLFSLMAPVPGVPTPLSLSGRRLESPLTLIAFSSGPTSNLSQSPRLLPSKWFAHLPVLTLSLLQASMVLPGLLQ